VVAAQEVDRGDAGLLEQRLGLLDVVAVDGLRPPVGGVSWLGRLIELEAGAVQPEHYFTCSDQLINNEAIFTKTKQVQSRNIAVVDEKLNDECEHGV